MFLVCSCVFLLVLGTSLIQGLPSLALEVDANSVLAEVGGWFGVVCSVSMARGCVGGCHAWVYCMYVPRVCRICYVEEFFFNCLNPL